MKIGVLTSSRADFGIYLPLLKKLESDPFFELLIIAFGTHVSKYHGNTVTEIKAQGFNNIITVSSLLIDDSQKGISNSYGLTVMKFSEIWAQYNFDLVLTLGDRYEMSAAVQAGIPFNMKFAHIHGGETTLGAIDNIYRHQITLASTLHFTSTTEYKHRIKDLIKNDKLVFNVGSLSLDDIDLFKFAPELEFRKKFGLLEKPYVLCTFHPETTKPSQTEDFAIQVCEALAEISKEYTVVITMPNADTHGIILRKQILELKENHHNIVCKESFGKINYFNAMKYCEFLVGNTSSGILEAASFNKYVINVGDRQAGRLQSKNIINCTVNKHTIIEAMNAVKKLGNYKGANIYKQPNTSDKISNLIKLWYEIL